MNGSPLPPLTINAWLRHDAIVAALAEVPPGAPLLEIGAGQGAFGARLAARFAYTGVEQDPVSAATARRRIAARSPDATVLEGTTARLAAEGRFAAVCAFEVLEHLEDDRAALAEWVRHLAPGGRLVLSVPAHQRRMGPWDRKVGHYRRYDPGQLARLLRDAGLTDVREVRYGFPVGYVLETVRNAYARRRGFGDDAADPGEMAARTAASGRSLQVGRRLTGVATWAAAWPFRILQRPFARTRLGTGIVASARR